MKPRQHTGSIGNPPLANQSGVVVVELQWVETPTADTWVEADLVTEVTDLADVYIETFRQGILHENQLHLQEQRDHAEERRVQGLAGICETCGDWIPPERLEIVPYATRCVSCQSSFEKRNSRQIASV